MQLDLPVTCSSKPASRSCHSHPRSLPLAHHSPKSFSSRARDHSTAHSPKLHICPLLIEFWEARTCSNQFRPHMGMEDHSSLMSCISNLSRVAGAASSRMYDKQGNELPASPFENSEIQIVPERRRWRRVIIVYRLALHASNNVIFVCFLRIWVVFALIARQTIGPLLNQFPPPQI